MALRRPVKPRLVERQHEAGAVPAFAKQRRNAIAGIIVAGVIVTWLATLPALSFAAVLVDVLVSAPDSAGGYRTASPSERKQVALTRGARRLESSAGLELEDVDEIQTGKSTSVLIRYPEGHEVLVTSGTHVRLRSMFVLVGEIFVRARGFFRVETQFLTAGVEGTEFAVRTGEVGDDVEVLVVEGAVICESKAGLWRPVRVARSEQLSARALSGRDNRMPGAARPPRPVPSPGAEAEKSTVEDVIYRGPSGSLVEKFPALGTDLARVAAIARGLDGFARR